MDEALKIALAPLQAGPFIIGFVPEIHEKGAERPFEISEYELEILAQHWSEVIKEIQDGWDNYQTIGSAESRLVSYAHYRLSKIGEILGEDRLRQLVEDVNKQCSASKHLIGANS